MPNRFAISAPLLRGLVNGDGPEIGVVDTLIAARLSKILLLLRHLLVSQASAATHVAQLCLVEASRCAPSAFHDVLAYPAVGVWLINQGHDESVSAGLARIAAAVAVRGGVPAELRFSAPGPIVLPSLGSADTSGSDDEPIVFRSDGHIARFYHGSTTTNVPSDAHRTVAGWRGLVKIHSAHRGRTWTVLLDPDLFGPGQSLSQDEIALWATRLAGGWARLVDRHPVAAGEIARTIRAVTPMARANRPLSATRADAYGCVLMNEPVDDLSCALTLVHECQHAKLSGFLDITPLITDSPRLFYAPWRDDPRPAVGLLHGLYAHLGVAGFWLRERELGGGKAMDVEYLRWRTACLDVCRTLTDSGLLTKTGTLLVKNIRDEMSSWPANELVSGARVAAARCAADHYNQWHSTQ